MFDLCCCTSSGSVSGSVISGNPGDFQIELNAIYAATHKAEEEKIYIAPISILSKFPCPCL